MENIGDYIQLGLAVSGFFSLVANLTPNESDDKIMKKVNKILGFLAANFNVKGIANKK